ncbi:WYL domain-containing protein [Inquilinus sp. CAU 1745]|uniref:tellurite resistance TerB family protein n=1 Tax=Inquilinus sp. CAU 1745 TaxID=3140369 RepID=UPI00325B6D97
MAHTFAAAGLDTEDDEELLLDIDLDEFYEDEIDLYEEEKKSPSRKSGIFGREDIKRIDEDLWGVTFAIEYKDSKGASSRRRITLHHLYEVDGGRRYLYCLCHERKAKRTFRFDRVQTIIDLDGVVHQPETFFAEELRVVWPQRSFTTTHSAPGSATTNSVEKPGAAHRRIARDGLRVLAALARTDGFLHPEEIEVILQYIGRKAEAVGLEMSEDDRGALVSHLRRQFPNVHVLEKCVKKLELEPVVDQKLLLRHAITLVNVDGVQDENEFNVLLDLQQRLETTKLLPT